MDNRFQKQNDVLQQYINSFNDNNIFGQHYLNQNYNKMASRSKLKQNITIYFKKLYS